MCDPQAQSSAPYAGGHVCCRRPTTRLRRRFPGLSGQVKHARRFVARCLAGAPEVDSAILLTSELVTNAIAHSASGEPGGKFEIMVSLGDGWACVEVADLGGPGTPSPQERDPYDISEHGRGLDLVEALAHSWGTVQRAPAPGRAVWFVLAWDAADPHAVPDEEPAEAERGPRRD